MPTPHARRVNTAKTPALRLSQPMCHHTHVGSPATTPLSPQRNHGTANVTRTSATTAQPIVAFETVIIFNMLSLTTVSSVEIERTSTLKIISHQLISFTCQLTDSSAAPESARVFSRVLTGFAMSIELVAGDLPELISSRHWHCFDVTETLSPSASYDIRL